jgi:hypothetical protein
MRSFRNKLPLKVEPKEHLFMELLPLKALPIKGKNQFEFWIFPIILYEELLSITKKKWYKAFWKMRWSHLLELRFPKWSMRIYALEMYL